MEMDDFYDEIDDNEEFDEFLFESIQRYNTLQMFNLENIPYQLLQFDDTSLCVGSKRAKGDNSELLRLRLPDKLTLPPEEEGRCKGNDFKVLSGIYTEFPIYKIDKFPKDGNIIASEYNVCGLKIYTLNQSALGSKNQGTKLDVTNWAKSDFLVVKDSDNLICSKCCCEPLIHADVAVGKVVKEIKHPFQSSNAVIYEQSNKNDLCKENNIKVQSFDTNLITILNCQSGDLVMHDLRTDNSFVSLHTVQEKQGNEIWTLSGCDYNRNCNYFGILSNRKGFYIFDKRNNSFVVHNQGTDTYNGDLNYLNLKFSRSGDKFSISGVDSLVEIFKINGNEFHHVFTHNGHHPSKSSTNVVTDHIWLETGNKEFVVSICDNKTLNCWDYNVLNVEKKI